MSKLEHNIIICYFVLGMKGLVIFDKLLSFCGCHERTIYRGIMNKTDDVFDSPLASY